MGDERGAAYVTLNHVQIYIGYTEADQQRALVARREPLGDAGAGVLFYAAIAPYERLARGRWEVVREQGKRIVCVGAEQKYGIAHIV